MRKFFLTSLLGVLLAQFGCGQSSSTHDKQSGKKPNQPIDLTKMERAIFASGCFWGTEYYMQKAEGVVKTTCGYTGGHVDNPTYRQVCTGTTGHAEAVEVYYDPALTNFETVCKLFFETHDPTQVNRQGPDIGHQYRSGVFFLNEEQREITNKLIGQLKAKGFKVATEVTKATTFYPAEDYHQDYYDHKGSSPYCHFYTKRFD